PEPDALLRVRLNSRVKRNMHIRHLVLAVTISWSLFAMADEAMIYAETQFTVGAETVLESGSPENSFMVVFEDDGDTGYFYGLDRSRDGNLILDALHIYNVANVTDMHLPSNVQIVRSGDGNKS